MFARLRIHHKQIRPGRALYLFRAWRCRAVSSPGDTARGPTKDMSPFNMLKSTGMRRRKRGDSENEYSSNGSHQRPARLVFANRGLRSSSWNTATHTISGKAATIIASATQKSSARLRPPKPPSKASHVKVWRAPARRWRQSHRSSIRAFAEQNRRDSRQEQLDIQPETLAFDVLQVQLHLLRKGNVAAPAHLPNTGQAGCYVQTTPVGQRVEPHFARHGRPWTDQRHVALENTPQLGQLVDAEFPDNAPDPGHPGILLHLEGHAISVLVLREQRVLQ